MRRLLFAAFVLGSLSLLVSRAAAQTTTINFDDLSASTCVYGSAPGLDIQYAAMGATFSGNLTSSPHVVPASCLTISGASTPNIVGLDGSGNYLRVDLAPSVATVSMAVGNYNRIETFTLTAYDTDGAVLGMTTFSPPYRMFGTISVSASGISAVVLTAAHSENAIDDLTFSSTPPPVDAGAPDLGLPDLGVADLGTPDLGVLDLGAVDASAGDAGGIDAGDVDAGTLDAGAGDAGATDAGAPDAGSADAGGRDAAVRDASGADATVDAGGTPAGGGCCRVAGGGSAPWSTLAVIVALVLVRTRRRR